VPTGLRYKSGSLWEEKWLKKERSVSKTWTQCCLGVKHPLRKVQKSHSFPQDHRQGPPDLQLLDPTAKQKPGKPEDHPPTYLPPLPLPGASFSNHSTEPALGPWSGHSGAAWVAFLCFLGCF
jgi:hypothetical protein